MTTILIVDDRQTNRELLVTLLGYAGHHLLEATDGEAGLEIARAEHPDLIITDIVMPKMDGYEFARQVRADPIIAKTQIIFYTSSFILEETRRLAEACGVSLVIGKPIEPQDFLEQVQGALAMPPLKDIQPHTEEFHHEHMRLLTDTLAKKVEELEAEITERKRTEEELRKSEERFQAIFEQAAVGLSLQDPDGRWLQVNQKLCDLVGYSRAELLELTFRDITYPDDLNVDLQHRNRLIVGKLQSYSIAKRYVHKNGRPVWANLTASLVRDSSGTPKYFITVVEDISKRILAEKELNDAKEKYHSLFENTPISIWEEDFSQVKQKLEGLIEAGITDLRAHFTAHPEELSTYIAMVRITDVNKAALRMYEAKNRDEMLKNAQNLFHQMPKSFLEELLAIAQGRLTFQWEGEDQTLTGKKMIVDLNWIVTPGYEADYSKIVVSTIDVTETRLAEERLRALNAELEQRVANRTLELTRANRAKDEFLATMSHELRTPLNSILGLSETMLEELRGPLNEYQRNSLQIIESSGRHLLELINDVLDLSKIEAGKFDYYPQIVDVDALCRSSLAFVKEQALRKSITLEYQALAVASEIYADPRRLKQILVNLLTNAVKFTPEGGKVTLQIQSNVEVDLMQISVIDTGIGIAPDDLPQLFQPFVQVDSALNRQFEGTGLGLALVQRLTDMHGGSVEVDSQVGQGSRFTVNLPWRQKIIAQQETIDSGERSTSAASFSSSDETAATDKVILLAEDNDSNILTVGEYLESYGYRVVIARDGAEAIEKAGETQPHLILMDIQMPVMDGLEAIRRLRTDSRFDSTPIIALTALAMPGDRERCLEAGANEYMSKPVSLKNLVALITKLLHPAQ